jgi:hypothetical protein
MPSAGDGAQYCALNPDSLQFYVNGGLRSYIESDPTTTNANRKLILYNPTKIILAAPSTEMNGTVYSSGSYTTDGTIFAVGTITTQGNCDVTGHVYCNTVTANAYNYWSDRRLKTNIAPIENAENIIKSLEPVQYEFLNNLGVVQHGLIAQDVYDIYPFNVSVGDDDLPKNAWKIDYAKFTPILISGLKSVISKIEQLEDKIQEIENRLSKD